MKKLLIVIPIIALLASCGGDCKQKCKKDKPEEMEALKIKLEATEAQLLNISAELSKCKTGKNDLEVKDNELDN